MRQAIESEGRLTTLKHNNSDLVDNLRNKEIELWEETAQIVKIFRDFQSKVFIIEFLY